MQSLMLVAPIGEVYIPGPQFLHTVFVLSLFVSLLELNITKKIKKKETKNKKLVWINITDRNILDLLK